jgi:hypothetical protein
VSGRRVPTRALINIYGVSPGQAQVHVTAFGETAGKAITVVACSPLELTLPMTGDTCGSRNRRHGNRVGGGVLWLVATAFLAVSSVTAQEPTLSVAAHMAATGIFPSNIVRQVPHPGGGDRMTRVPAAPALAVGLSLSPGGIPVAIRLTGGRSVGASLEHKEHRIESCGADCTRTIAKYEYAGDASVTLLAADAAWTPPLPWAVRPYLVAGVFQKTIGYDRSDLPAHIEPFFRSSDVARGVRFGGGITSNVTERLHLHVEMLQQRGRAGSPRVRDIGEFWRQQDLVLSAGMTIPVESLR